MARNPRGRRIVRWCYRTLLILMPLTVIAGLAAITVPARAAAPAASSSSLPCDIYASDGHSCVAAYSMVRALYATYNGPLYQVQRASDGTKTNIGLLSAGSYVKASEQDVFCAGTSCTITQIYDQSPDGDTLTVEQGGHAAPAPDSPAVANALPITVDGHEAYGLDVTGKIGYRDDGPGNPATGAKGVATMGAAEGMYMVASGIHVNSSCCFDFGNAETANNDTGDGHMDTVNLSTTCTYGPCTGSGPWVQADLENGVYQGDRNNPANTPETATSSPRCWGTTGRHPSSSKAATPSPAD